MGEGLPTLATLVGLLPGVDWVVLCKVGPASEGLATIGARVGLLPTVGEVVPNEGRALAEGFPTCTALVGLHSRVNPLMADKVPLPAESLPTLLTFIEVTPCTNRGAFPWSLKVMFMGSFSPWQPGVQTIICPQAIIFKALFPRMGVLVGVRLWLCFQKPFPVTGSPPPKVP